MLGGRSPLSCPELLPSNNAPLELRRRCRFLGAGSEGAAWLCDQEVLKFFHCAQRRYPFPSPFNTPREIAEFWNQYYIAIGEPKQATATVHTASELFPQHSWGQCDHQVLKTPYVEGRKATNKEAAEAMRRYDAELELGLGDPDSSGNVKVTDKGPRIIDFGLATPSKYHPRNQNQFTD